MSGESFRNFVAVTPSDTATMQPTVALYVGGYATGTTPGDVTIVGREGLSSAPTTFKNVPPGTVLRVEAVRVMATNTTATSIVALR